MAVVNQSGLVVLGVIGVRPQAPLEVCAQAPLEVRLYAPLEMYKSVGLEGVQVQQHVEW